jgi:hypothetical protein
MRLSVNVTSHIHINLFSNIPLYLKLSKLNNQQNCVAWRNVILMRFQVLMAASMKFRVCRDVAPCSLVGVN